MEEIFFVRFSLQQSCGIFGANQFDCNDIISETKEQVAQYIAECSKWQEQKAEELRRKHRGILKLGGKKVLYIGDSLTADRLGYRGITTVAAGLDARSMAVSGATSVDMLRSVYGEVLKLKPEIISVLIGANDAFFVGGKDKVNLVGKEEYRRNLREILKVCKESGAIVLVLTIPDVSEKNLSQSNDSRIKTNDNENVSEYCNIVRDEAQRAGVVLVDLNRALKAYNIEEMIEPDGVHLNKKGQLMLADLWLETLIEEV